MFVAVKNGRVQFQIARAAIHRTALRRVKRNRSRFTAPSTIHQDFNTLLYSGPLGDCDGRQPVVLCFLTVLAAFRRIIQLLVAEECLFAGTPNKIVLTVDAFDRLIGKFIGLDRDGGCSGFASVDLVTSH